MFLKLNICWHSDKLLGLGKIDVENGSMHEMSVGDKKDGEMFFNVLQSASCKHVPLHHV